MIVSEWWKFKGEIRATQGNRMSEQQPWEGTKSLIDKKSSAQDINKNIGWGSQ